ncbi:MAG: SDR family oxidoreductase [Chloroflexota bacterium]
MDNRQSTTNKTALVTGASSGIGYELTKLFARDGYNLVLVARNEERLNQLKTEFEKRRGVSVKVLPKDLSDPNAPEEIYDELKRDGIQVDVLVNNAGYAMLDPFLKTDKQDELNMLQVNVVALTHMTKLFLPGMAERGSGRVLNIASTAAFMPGPLMAVYYATKAYVLSFTEAVAEEMRGTGVTLTALCPGPTRSGFQKRANMETSRLIVGRSIMDAPTVANAGYKALMRGKSLEIPGIRNKLIVLAAKLSPRSAIPGVVKRSQERAEG